MGTSHSNDALMLIGGLELLRHAIRSVQPKEERRTTYTEREIYDYDTKQIITLRTRTVTLTERR